MTNIGPAAEYQAKLQTGEFAIQKCGDCGSHIFYPRIICPECGSLELGWVTASGEGAVFSTSVVRRRPDRGGDYNVCIVELAEGPRMLSRVEQLAPEDVTIGLAVTARIVGKDDKFIVFDPVDGGTNG